MNSRLLLASTLTLSSAIAHACCSPYAETCTTCGYPFDATEQEMTALTLTPFPTTDATAQKVSLTVPNTNNIKQQYVAGNGQAATSILNGGTGNISVTGSGIIYFEMRVDKFSKKAVSIPESYLDLYLDVTDGGHYQYLIGVGNTNSSGYVSYGTEINGSANGDYKIMPYTLPFPSDYRVGIYINKATHQIGTTVNGVDQGYSPTLIPDNALAIAIFAHATTTSGERIIGDTAAATLITEAKKLSQPFPGAGATDICGNLIP